MYARETRSGAKKLLQMHEKLDLNNKTRLGANAIVNSEADLMETKLSKRLLGIIIIWILGWTPFAMVAAAQLSGKDSLLKVLL